MDVQSVDSQGDRSATSTALQTPLAPTYLSRPRLADRLDECLGRRLCTVIAGAGFGKSTLLLSWSAQVGGAWYTFLPGEVFLSSIVHGIAAALEPVVPGISSGILSTTDAPPGFVGSDDPTSSHTYAALITDAIHGEAERDVVLVLDDVHEAKATAEVAKFLEALCRLAPPKLHIVLASRDDLPFPVDRLRGRGELVEIGPRDLAFDLDEVHELLTLTIGASARDLAPVLHSVSDGWPVALRMAIEALRSKPETQWRQSIVDLRARGGPLISYLASEVFEHQPDDVRELIRHVAYVDRFTAEMCELFGFTDVRPALDRLEREGFFLTRVPDDPAWMTLSELTRNFVTSRFPLTAAREAEVRRQASEWLESRGYLADALRLCRLAGDHPRIAAFLAESGAALIASGAAEELVRATREIPEKLKTPSIQALEGEARQILGDPEGALACFEQAAGSKGRLDAGLAVRIGLIHYFRGDLDEAEKIYARGRLDGSDPANEARLLAWRSSVCWLRGDTATCRKYADRAFKIATQAGDPGALAVAHTSLAMLAALDGDRRANDWHYEQALVAANEAKDTLQIIRIRTNRASFFTEQGRYTQALEELAVSIPLAESSGFAAYQGLGLINRGWTLFQLGRLEEAIADLDAARSISQRAGSHDVGHALALLGAIYAERGESALARSSFEEAIAIGETSQDVQSLVPALAGLARLLVEEDPSEAAVIADRAMTVARGIDQVEAGLVVGWVAVANHQWERALTVGADAEKEARVRRDPAGIAESLELRAEASFAPETAIEDLEQAAAIWKRIGNPLARARTDLRRARLLGGSEGRKVAEDARDRLREIGARRLTGAADRLLASIDRGVIPALAIRSLGGFEVLRAGITVAHREWQSKKARDLLRILVAKRGRPVARESLMEMLWPGEDPEKLGNRMAVALATVRIVLDNQRRFPTDHFVASEQASISLRLENVEVDAEEFLSAADEGWRLLRSDRPELGLARLTEVEALYTGDFLEGEAYADWALGLREEARATYIAVAHTLAADASETDDLDLAIRLYLRILEKDGFDETAHLGLVTALTRAGRHGEARRAHRAYAVRMEEIEVEAAPFPSSRDPDATTR